MKPKAIAAIILLVALCVPLSVSKAQTIVTFPPSTWKMEAYGTWLTFTQDLSLEQWGYDQFPNVTTLFFYNPQMGGTAYGGWWWLKSPQGNVTVSRFFQDKKTSLQVQGSTGTQYTVNFPIGGMGKPASVTKNGATIDENKGWSIAGDTVTLQGTFHSADAWELSWQPADGGDGGNGGDGGGDGDGIINPVIPPINLPWISDEDLQKLGAAFIVCSVAFAWWYGQYKKGQKTWKPKKQKEVKWSKKGKPLE